ncbi:TonB-dependent receptor [Gluconobacter sp. Dm-62]|uniref:TonB-dependent receptor n=1 Tax=Gluconobacter sp. Dm-62 TaxID=2799804 RepID=UPI001B8B221E|nr:TonB-dependent receptor [Gluconobacter sp. Dm-62]MBS1102842.1 TonB-dependent receptor [Gluconobacter sp. Dm-62]
MKENLSLSRPATGLWKASFLASVCTALSVRPVPGWAASEPATKCFHESAEKPATSSEQCNISGENLTIWGKRAAFTLPVSTTHISAQDMASYRMQTLGDLAERVPNLSFTNTTPNNPVLMLRGLGGAEDEGPALYTPILIDGVPVPSFALGQMFDLKNVDILRGPQLTEGINAFGGLISAQSVDPTSRSDGALDFEYGTGNRKRATFSGDLTLNASTSLRLSVGGETADGYIHNRTLNRHDTGGWHGWFGRIKLLHKDNAGGEWRFSLHHMLNHGGNDYFETPQNARNHVSYNTSEGVNDTEYLLGSAQYHRRFSQHMILDVVFGGASTDWRYSNPYSVFSANSGFTLPTRQIGGSIMLSGNAGHLDWKGGIYGQQSKRWAPYTFDMSPYYLSRTTATLGTANIAFMGELGWHLFQDWRLVSSLRIEHVDSSLSNWTSVMGGDVPYAYSTRESLPRQSLSKTVPLPGLKIEYSPQSSGKLSQFGWLSYSRSFLPPNYSPYGSYTSTVSEPYTSSYGNNLELGYRLGDAGGRWSVEATGFANFLSNLQVSATNGAGESLIGTAGTAHSRGVEATAHWKPLGTLQLNAFMGLTYAAYDRFVFGGADYSGKQMSGTPRSNFGFSGEWQPVPGWALNASIVRRGRTTLYPSSSIQNAPYVLVDAQIERRWKHWNVALYGHNLTNSSYFTRGLSGGYVVASNPRQLGFRVGVNF